MIQGNDILVMTSGGAAIASSTSCEIDNVCDLKEVCSPTYGNSTYHIADRKSWTVTMNFLVYSDLHTAVLKVGDTVTISMYVRGSSTKLTGAAICTECSIEARRGALASGSFRFQGSGSLS